MIAWEVRDQIERGYTDYLSRQLDDHVTRIQHLLNENAELRRKNKKLNVYQQAFWLFVVTAFVFALLMETAVERMQLQIPTTQEQPTGVADTSIKVGNHERIHVE